MSQFISDKENSIGQKIRMYRKRSGLSQLQLELEIDASPGFISRIESGKVNPTKETIYKLGQVLKLSFIENADVFDLNKFPLVELLEVYSKFETYRNKENCDSQLEQILTDIASILNYMSIIVLLKKGNYLYAQFASHTTFVEKSLKVVGPLREHRVNIDKYPNNYFVKSILSKKIIEADSVMQIGLGMISMNSAKLIQIISKHKRGIAVPMLHGSDVLGCVYFTKHSVEEFSYEYKLLQLITDRISEFIHHSNGNS